MPSPSGSCRLVSSCLQRRLPCASGISLGSWQARNSPSVSLHYGSDVVPRGSRTLVPDRSMAWPSPTVCWSRWCICTWLPHAAPAELHGTALSTISPACEIRRYWPHVASPFPTAPASGCAPWRMYSPTPRPRGSVSESTAPGPRFAAPRPVRNRTQSRPPPSVMRAACCGGRSGPAACTTRPPRAPRASRRCSSSTRLRKPKSTKTIGVWPKKPEDDAPPGEHYAWLDMRRQHSSAQSCVEHTNAELRKRHPLQRYTTRREGYAETRPPIASLVPNGAAPLTGQPAKPACRGLDRGPCRKTADAQQTGGLPPDAEGDCRPAEQHQQRWDGRESAQRVGVRSQTHGAKNRRGAEQALSGQEQKGAFSATRTGRPPLC